jgi:hypothetical protein
VTLLYVGLSKTQVLRAFGWFAVLLAPLWAFLIVPLQYVMQDRISRAAPMTVEERPA